jgi:cell division septal protein FtsQ
MAVLFGGWALYGQVVRSPKLMVENINVTGFDRVSEAEALRAANLQRGRNILVLSTERAEAVIESNPYIEQATVVRILPDTVNVSVVERRPVVLVNMDGLFIMDAKGVLFKRYAPEDRLDIPVVTGLEEHRDKWKFTMGPALLELVRVLGSDARFNLSNISEINADPVHGFSVVTLKEGIRLDLGSVGFVEKFEILDKIIEARGGNLGGIEFVDLNNDRGVVVRFAASVNGRRGTI